MKRMAQLIMIGIVLMATAGCQKYELMNEQKTFSDGGSSFSFQLPSGWQIEDEYKEVFNDAALFGAEDTNSRSVMFVRAQKSEKLNEQQLRIQTRAALEQYYLVDEIEEESFRIGNFAAVYYPLKSVYDNRAVWLDNYFIATETHVVEFLFYRPRQGSSDGQQEIIRKSVETLKQVEAIASSDQEIEEAANYKVTTDTFSIQLTGHRIQEGKLILRYVLTNNSEQSLVPLEEWKNLMEVTEQEQRLHVIEEMVDSDSELSYLQDLGKQRLQAGDSIETAVSYDLQSNQGDITISTDEEQLKDAAAVMLKIER